MPMPTAPVPSALPPRGMLLCLLAPPGMGKSSFGAEWPAPHFVIDPRDEGIIDLIYEGAVNLSMASVHQCSDYTGYKSNLHNCINNPACKTIVCESVGGIMDLCWAACSTEQFDGDLSKKKFLNFQDGPTIADQRYFAPLCDLMQMAQRRGKHVILMGHIKTKQKPNVAGEDWLESTLAADKYMTARVEKTFQNILQMADVVSTLGKKIGVKAESDFQRFVYTHQNPQYFAKNRMGLTSAFQCPMTAKAFYFKFCEVTHRNPKTGYRHAS